MSGQPGARARSRFGQENVTARGPSRVTAGHRGAMRLTRVSGTRWGVRHRRSRLGPRGGRSPEIQGDRTLLDLNMPVVSLRTGESIRF
jgi:hypothetical protein